MHEQRYETGSTIITKCTYFLLLGHISVIFHISRMLFLPISAIIDLNKICLELYRSSINPSITLTFRSYIVKVLNVRFVNNFNPKNRIEYKLPQLYLIPLYLK